jgi:hypothetical protein
MRIQGCTGLETDATSTWRWCDSDVDLIFLNGMQAGNVRLEGGLADGFAVASNVFVKGPGISDHLQVNSSGTSFHETWSIPPGRSVIHIHTDAPDLVVAGDPRPLRFRFVNLELHEPTNSNPQQPNSGQLVPSVSDKFLILN